MSKGVMLSLEWEKYLRFLDPDEIGDLVLALFEHARGKEVTAPLSASAWMLFTLMTDDKAAMKQ